MQIPKTDNQRITKQRKIVLEELCKVCNHPTAIQVHKLVLKKNPNVGLATIYRTLDFLEKKNLIIKLQTKDKEARYDGNTNGHLHLVCKKCSEVIDIFDAKEINIKSDQLKKTGFQTECSFLEIPGLCQKCK